MLRALRLYMNNQTYLFPYIKHGWVFNSKESIKSYITAIWKLTIDGRALLEDIQGGRQQPPLQQVLVIRFFELLYELETDLCQQDIDAIHFYSLFLENGVSFICNLTPERAEAAGLFDSDIVNATNNVEAIWESLLNTYPANIPNPLLAEQQFETLKLLRLWDKVCRAYDIDVLFLKKLMSEV